MDVNKREFVRHVSKYLREGGEYRLVGRGGIESVVTIKLSYKKMAEVVRQAIEKVGELPIEKMDRLKDLSEGVKTHGCGCRDKGVLCAKHGRF